MLPSVRWYFWIVALAGLLTLGGCDRTPDRPVARPPRGRSGPAPSSSAPLAIPAARLTRFLDTTTVGAFFGTRKLLRPYRADAQTFYAARGGQLGWFRADGTPRPQAHKLLTRIRQVEKDGLDPARYHLAALERQIKALSPDSIAVAADSLVIIRRQRALDLHLTGTYFLLLGDYALGSVDAQVNGAGKWSDRRQYVHLARSLTSTLAARDTSAAT